MTSILPDLNISKSPIYESLVASRGDPYQVDTPARGWSLPAASTDFGAANDILGRLLAQGGSDGQGWVAVVLVGGPAAAQLSQQLAQGAMAGGYNPLAAYQVLQAIQTMQAMQALQNQGQPWPQPELPYTVTAVADDPISASMASNMAAGIVRNALEASSPSGFMYDQYADQPDPYAASALTPAAAYPGAMQPTPPNYSGYYPAAAQPEMAMPADPTGQYAAMQAQMQAQAQPDTGMPTSALPPGADMSEWINAANAAALQAAQSNDDGSDPRVPMPTMTFPPGSIPMTPGAYPGYPGAKYAAIGQPAAERDREEDSVDGRRRGRFASAMRELRRR